MKELALHEAHDHGFTGQVIIPLLVAIGEGEAGEAHTAGILSRAGVHEIIDVIATDTRPFHVEVIAPIAIQLDASIRTVLSQLAFQIGREA